MNFATVEPKATRRPIVSGSASKIIAAFDAIRRFEGPAKGIMFRINEVSRMLQSSYKAANYLAPFRLFHFY